MSQSSLGQDFREEMEEMVRELSELLPDVIRRIDDRMAHAQPGSEAVLRNFREPLPMKGCGAASTIERLVELNETAGANSAGPKSYHFVIGGSTPAAMVADLLATAYEAIPYTWVLSPAGVEMELQALDWLKELFELPSRVVRRDGHRCDDGELRLPGIGATMVG